MEHRPLWFVIQMKKTDIEEKEMWFSAITGKGSKGSKDKNTITLRNPNNKIPAFLLRPGSRYA